MPGYLGFLGRRAARTGGRRPAALGFFFASFVWCLMFFSAAGSKRPAYIMPALPPLSLALGCYLAAIVPERRWRLATSTFASRFAVLPLRATAIVLVLGAGIALGAAGMELIKPALGFALIGTASLAGALLTWRARRLFPTRAWWICATATFA